MIAAPHSIVAISVSWPGASTNETARRNSHSPPPSGTSGSVE